MSMNQKRAVLILAGIVILACTFFFLYQPNADKVTELEAETANFQRQINFLSTMQMQVNQMREVTPEYTEEITEFMDKFPSRMTQPKAIYNVYRMMIKTGIRVRSISPGVEQTFFSGGNLSGMGGDSVGTANAAGTTDPAAAASPGGVEAEPEILVPVHEMVGKVTPYELTISGSLKQIEETLDWISENEEHMAVTDVSLTYDSSTGKLSGTMSVNYYAMNGNGVMYEEPDISGIIIGSKNIFGTVK